MWAALWLAVLACAAGGERAAGRKPSLRRLPPTVIGRTDALGAARQDARPVLKQAGGIAEAIVRDAPGGEGVQNALTQTFDGQPPGASSIVVGSAGNGTIGLAKGSLSPSAPKAALPAPARSTAPAGWRRWVQRARTWVQPTLVLRPGRGPADAMNLVQGRYGYKADPAFTGPMAAAIDEAAERLRRGPMTDRDVMAQLAKIAGVRRTIAYAAKDDDAYQFGLAIPESREEMQGWASDRYHTAEDWDTSSIWDYVYRDPSHRHSPFFAEAAVAAKRLDGGKERPKIVVDGEEYTVSGVAEAFAGYVVMHPHHSDTPRMRWKAYAILAEAVNDASLTPERFVDRAAAAYQLLMHATPWVRGTPSVVEAFLDAALRAKYGLSLPPKTNEPFWDVILRDPRRGVYRGRDLLRNFGA